jgi:eukaryotic-like serine/threonine-protein kinase
MAGWAIVRPRRRLNGEAEHTGILLDGRYRVLTRLGQGGMGTVYAAEHVGLGQRRAVKFLREDIGRKPGAIRRFLQEARVLSSLHHEHLVGVLDMGEYAGTAYYVMEFLEGEDLRARLRRDGALNWARTREVALQVCEALRITHTKGIVHRDLKPENCYCIRQDPGVDAIKLKLIDFGVAKVPKEMGGVSQLTGTGEALGTIGYMAPEQMEGQGDHRVDVYSLGTMLFEMLAGRPVYLGNAYEVISKMLLGQPPLLRTVCPAAAPEIEALISRATSKDPSLRFPTMEAFAAAITAIPADAEPRTVHDRRTTAPDLPRTPGASINGEANTMPASGPTLDPSLGARDTDAVSRSLASGSVIRTPVLAALPAPRRRPLLLGIGAAGLGAALTLAWLASSDPDPPPTPPAEPVAPAKLETRTTAPPEPVKPPAPPVEPPPTTPDPAGLAVAQPPVAPPPTPATPPPAVKLTHQALKRRLERELQACRSKFAEETITIRVVPGRTGQLESLTTVSDAQLAAGIAGCIETNLARVQRTLKDSLAAKKAFDLSLVLGRAP